MSNLLNNIFNLIEEIKTFIIPGKNNLHIIRKGNGFLNIKNRKVDNKGPDQGIKFSEVTMAPGFFKEKSSSSSVKVF
jgi:hypothetical protein